MDTVEQSFITAAASVLLLLGIDFCIYLFKRYKYYCEEVCIYPPGPTIFFAIAFICSLIITMEIHTPLALKAEVSAVLSFLFAFCPMRAIIECPDEDTQSRLSIDFGRVRYSFIRACLSPIAVLLYKWPIVRDRYMSDRYYPCFIRETGSSLVTLVREDYSRRLIGVNNVPQPFYIARWFDMWNTHKGRTILVTYYAVLHFVICFLLAYVLGLTQHIEMLRARENTPAPIKTPAPAHTKGPRHENGTLDNPFNSSARIRSMLQLSRQPRA